MRLHVLAGIFAVCGLATASISGVESAQGILAASDHTRNPDRPFRVTLSLVS